MSRKRQKLFTSATDNLVAGLVKDIFTDQETQRVISEIATVYLGAKSNELGISLEEAVKDEALFQELCHEAVQEARMIYVNEFAEQYKKVKLEKDREISLRYRENLSNWTNSIIERFGIEGPIKTGQSAKRVKRIAGEKTEQKKISFPPDLAADLKAAADARGVSFSRHVLDIVTGSIPPARDDDPEP